MTSARRAGAPVGGTRERLARAAVELFQSKGYEATTIDEIAARAGVGRRTFFRYFRTKEEVIFPDHERLLAQVEERLFASRKESAFEAIAHATRLVLAHYVETREVSLQRYRLVGEVPTLREREIVSAAAYQRLFRQRLESEERGDVASGLRAELVASAIATAHNFVLRRWLRDEGTGDPFAHLDEALMVVKEQIGIGERASLERFDRSSGDGALLVLAFDGEVDADTIAAEVRRARGRRDRNASDS